MEDGFGLQIEFESSPDVELAFESLARERSGVDLLNVRRANDSVFATVFVPEGKLRVFESLITAYLDETRDTAAGAKNRKLLNTIEKIRAATIEALWTDDESAFPENDDDVITWEVWLPVKTDRAAVVDQFRTLSLGLGLRLGEGELSFPERTVVLARGSKRQLASSIVILNNIAELRRAKETAGFFDALPPAEQPAWADELLGRLTMPNASNDVPYVCILDTGVNNGHALLAPAIDPADLHTVEPGWGVDDAHGHGTEMAGISLIGNLTHALDYDDAIEIGHRLESVKIIPDNGANGDESEHHGLITIEAVARSELANPGRRRVFSMAIAAADNRDRGRPSAWSAAIDGQAYDTEGQGLEPRLFILCAGNIRDQNQWKQYPDSNTLAGIHDPGQAWNALTVGAFTNLVNITEPGAGAYDAIASAGGLSPFSTTSVSWQDRWPLKPDVVFEGGNAAIDEISAVTMPSLMLLTTNHKPAERLFTTTNATSAATALASQMAAQLMGEYPDLWPETIRALISHSAEWTQEMLRSFLPTDRAPTKKDILSLVRHCGYGTPNLERALWSVDNSLTMVSESSLKPFKRAGNSKPTLSDMNLHVLPWPLAELEGLGDTAVEMRVTLSYFVEPNPSARGVTSRYRYESHCLRFEVKRALETEEEFRARINQAARDEEVRMPAGGQDPNWLIGKQARHRGSLHSDIWSGSAAELASRGVLAVYPAMGWWKSRVPLRRYEKSVRYALLVSITAPETDVNLYTAIANQLGVEIQA